MNMCAQYGGDNKEVGNIMLLFK